MLVADAAGQVDQLAQGDAERRLELAGAVDVTGQREDAVPLDFSVPNEANHSAPCSMMLGTDAIDSTLLMTVGLA